MNLDYVRSELARAGWGNLQPRPHMGIDFDLAGSRRFFLITKWDILVKVVPLFDQETANHWQANFTLISNRSKSLLWGRCFMLCLIAEQVSPEVQHSLSTDSFGLFGVIRLQGGGGNVVIADATSRQVYGKVPALPYDVHKFSKSTVEILTRALQV